MRKAILLVSLASLLGLVASQTAFATHPIPANGGAKKMTFTMVPAFKQCTAPNSTHGAPLGAPSCTPASPATQISRNLTIGTKATSSFLIEVFCTNAQAPPCPAAGEQENVKLEATATDVRCKSGTAAAVCPNENGAPAGVQGNDYTGETQANANIRITDAYNGPPGFTTHGTVQDLPFPVPAVGAGTGVQCVGTAGDATVGSTCTTITTAEAVVPDVIKDGKKAITETGQIFVTDGGSDGDIDTPGPPARPNERFTNQGIYIP